ncbi:MAG TPA: TonB-dependent receptor plug domain-containing protein, partial [Novosphingobium sp.]|nr:TonB-dependent receptor plug domain-containing protein [Novosphingobium sp.]
MKYRRLITASLAASVAAIALGAGQAQAAEGTPAPEAAPADTAADDGATILVTAKATRSATTVTASEIQKLLPGISPLKAIQTLPGVFYVTADPWGNNEQNAQLYIHGFSASQLGYTMDDIPLGDQNYGNFNGLSPSRALISENTARTVVATGAGELGIASTSNLGGAVQVYSRDPEARRGIDVSQTVGMYGTSRTFVRVDTGEFGGGNKLYLSGDRQRARAWDFNGIQGGYQANGKFIHEDNVGKLTAYFAYSDKIEPNEDATVMSGSYRPATRPFTYPNFAAARSYVDAYGNTPSSQGSNYNNYYSDAQRTDYLAYLKYDLNLGKRFKWSNQIYYHHNDGVGVVAGPLGQSITVVQAYLDPNYSATATSGTAQRYASNGNGSAALVAATGGSGYVIRTTEYRIMRKGVISTLQGDLGNHHV